jgi:hypothetical protein
MWTTTHRGASGRGVDGTCAEVLVCDAALAADNVASALRRHFSATFKTGGKELNY